MEMEKINNRSINWLILVHHFPKRPGSLRMKIWRRLQRIGAITIKNSLYVLPSNDQTREDFEWLLQEIITGGAEGAILEAQFIQGMDDQQIKQLFNEARDEDYQTLTDEIKKLQSTFTKGIPIGHAELGDIKNQITRFKKTLMEIDEIDFFGAGGWGEVNELVLEFNQALTAQMDEEPSEEGTLMKEEPEDLRGKIWVTRANIHVDRLASAWLVHKWIDPKATFKFTPNKDYTPEQGEVRFDMFEAEYTHEGDKCTFEVLLNRAGLNDPNLKRIGEIIHDIDLKDNKYDHDETAGIALMLSGLYASTPDDYERLNKGGEMFDNLYHIFKRRD